MPQAITRCRICGNRRLEAVLELGVQKLTGVFPTSPAADLLVVRLNCSLPTFVPALRSGSVAPLLPARSHLR